MAAIQSLARLAANAGLNLRDARWLFDTLYCTDALAQTQGNHTKAAGILGIRREALCRIRKRHEDTR